MVNWTYRTINLKEKISKKTMFYSLIIFAISLVIFNATTNDMWLALSGFAMIISGAVVALFILIYFILKIMEGLNRKNQPNKIQTIKKISKPTKKTIKKKIAPAKKKTIVKKIAKKKVVKKTTSKKRK